MTTPTCWGYYYVIKRKGVLVMEKKEHSNDVTFREVSYKETKPFLLYKHYAHRMPSISYSYGVEMSGKLVGVLTFGSPASRNLVIGVAGKEYAKNVIELNRLYIDEGISKTNLASQLVSYGLKKLKPLNKIVVSYADSGMGHIGYIYQATNFLYTGKTKTRTDKWVGVGKHSRHYENGCSSTYRAVRSPKYRYIFIAGDKRFKRGVLSHLNYKPVPYPKGDDRHYKVGDTKPTILVDKEGNRKVIYS